MKIIVQYIALAFTLLLQVDGLACSVCKVTINGRTYLGNNEDNWRIGSRVWFEDRTFGKFGAVYVGYGDNFPQGGMNEAGLAFDGLAIYPKAIIPDPLKKTETNSNTFIREIMQNCATVEDVMNYAIKFNRPFNKGVVFFADKFGKYLVMEPDTMTIGNDSKYIIANFCPSTTSDEEKLIFERYKRGNNFLHEHIHDTSSNYCLALVETMHECRDKIGDGTMYSFIADLAAGDFTLYFYHDFKHKKVFNLKTELGKGNHSFEMIDIFPPNAEYRKLVDFKIPQNNGIMRMLLICYEILFSFSALFFLVSFIRTKKSVSHINSANPQLKFVLFAVNALLLYYVNALSNNQAIFYFPSPYHDWKFSMLNIAAYIPFLILILIVPLITQNVKIVKTTTWTTFSKSLYTLNSLAYLSLIFLFTYWKLYHVF